MLLTPADLGHLIFPAAARIEHGAPRLVWQCSWNRGLFSLYLSVCYDRQAEVVKLRATGPRYLNLPCPAHLDSFESSSIFSISQSQLLSAVVVNPRTVGSALPDTIRILALPRNFALKLSA